jgi:hypothetical protein
MNLRIASLTGLLALALASAPAAAQSALEMPAPSPKAKVEQRVGVTDFAVEYSSPAVKGRAIWGALVPFDQLWRTGANAATKFTASRDFSFAGTAVPKGTYALFTIPGKSSWTVILNTKADASGTAGYDEKNDVARVTLTPASPGAPVERLTFTFADTSDDAAKLVLDWEKVRVAIPISVDTKDHVRGDIDKTLGDAWRPHFQSARWLLESNGDLDQALAYVTTSIAIKPNWWNNWVKAQILGKKGMKAEAIAAAEQSQALGKGDNVFGFFSEDIAKALADWKKK